MTLLTDSAPPIRILLVDDHDISRLGVRSLIEKYPEFIVIAEASNGKEAIERCESEKPDLIVMDVYMPVLDGIDATRHLKQSKSPVKILVLTEADHDDEVFSAFAAGADGYCLKQTTAGDLRLALLSVSRGAAWIDSVLAARVLRAATDVHTVETPAVPGGHSKLFGLSPRELEVLSLIVEGHSNKLISGKLCISDNTVKTHIRRIMEKLMVSDRTQAAVKALKEGVLSGTSSN